MKTLTSLVLVLFGFVPAAYAQSYHVVNFQAQSGHYVVAEGGGGSVLNADRGSAGSWEFFELYDANGGGLESDDEIYIRTSGGYYATQYCLGPNYVHHPATVTAIQCHSSATIYKFDSNNNYVSGPIYSGDQVVIAMWHGIWQAESGGGARLLVTNNGVGSWEKFFITIW